MDGSNHAFAESPATAVTAAVARARPDHDQVAYDSGASARRAGKRDMIMEREAAGQNGKRPAGRRAREVGWDGPQVRKCL